MTLLAEAKDYSENEGTLMVKYWKGSGHNEWYWQQHCSAPLEFLLSAHISGIESIQAPSDSSNMIYTLEGIPVGNDSEMLSPGIYCRHDKKFIRKSMP